MPSHPNWTFWLCFLTEKWRNGWSGTLFHRWFVKSHRTGAKMAYGNIPRARLTLLRHSTSGRKKYTGRIGLVFRARKWRNEPCSCSRNLNQQKESSKCRPECVSGWSVDFFLPSLVWLGSIWFVFWHDQNCQNACGTWQLKSASPGREVLLCRVPTLTRKQDFLQSQNRVASLQFRVPENVSVHHSHHLL